MMPTSRSLNCNRSRGSIASGSSRERRNSITRCCTRAFWLEHALWGDSVRGYHVVSLLWHLISVSLVYFILVRLKIPGALLAAAIFAVHPVMVESVAWISEQKNTLSAVFYLSAILVYLEFDESRRRGYYFTALGLFVLGLLTKTVTATLPAALLVIFWWQRGKLSWKSDARPLVPFFRTGRPRRHRDGLGREDSNWRPRQRL